VPYADLIKRKEYNREYAKRYYVENYERVKANRDRNHAKIRNDPVLWRKKLDDGIIRSQEWRAKNPEKFKAGIEKWRKTEKGRISTNASKLKSGRKHPEIALKRRVRSRIGIALRKGYKKFYSSPILLGCSYAELKSHLENLFQPGMTWENRREWEIDHIRPCASFDLMDPEQQKCCFHYTNLQPLWRHENRVKGARCL
jgi:hypothetical protein